MKKFVHLQFNCNNKSEHAKNTYILLLITEFLIIYEKYNLAMKYIKCLRLRLLSTKEGANKRGNSSRLTQSFHFFMFEPIFSPVNALNQPI
ncbi:hypothetical protein G689_00283 [Escherichia coli HVH 10 (4-6832164)]|nr:hypothetical protein G689_00283 [Escherichia coli HVH 10 (4-6832164)]